MSLRTAIHAALEALGAGDQREATQILLSALEDYDVHKASVACEHCGLRFRWPGQLDHHLRFSHWKEAA